MDQYYLKQKKILLVDDEREILEMITDFLSEDGYSQIRTAGTVNEALRTAGEWKPDLAVLDIMLPDGDGFSLFEQMRRFTEIPVLFLTARGDILLHKNLFQPRKEIFINIQAIFLINVFT